MRIIECNIMNFGTLCDFHFDFSDGINRIVRGNGFGKSTLAAFIRVMLYGFEGEGKRDSLSRERKFYEPWQGGNYGGEIVFSVGEKCYRVTRTFGKKADTDTFELRDVRTNLVVNDYSEHLGIELFDMDSDTFRRTVFVGQDGVETSVNDTINGRIGALVDNTDDLDAFEKAKTSLEEMINSLTPRRKTGEVSRLNERITGLDADIMPASELEKSMESVLEMREKEDDNLKQLREEKNRLATKAKELGAYMEIETGKERYEKLLSDRTAKAEELESYRKELPEGIDISRIPDSMKLRSLAQNHVKASAELMSTKYIELTEREEENYQRLKALYDGEDPTGKAEGYVETWREIKEREREITEKEELRVKAEKEMIRETTNGNRYRIACLAVSLVFIIVAVVLFVTTDDPTPGFVTCAFAMLGVILSFVLAAPHRSNAKQRGKERDILKRDTDILKDRNESDCKEISAFLSKYKKDVEPDMIPVSLRDIVNEHEIYLGLESKRERAVNAAQEARTAVEQIDRFVSEMLGADISDDPVVRLQHLADISDKAKDALNAYDQIVNKISDFERENDIEAIKNTVVPKTDESLSDITARLKDVTELEDESAKRLALLDKRSDELAQNLDEISSKRVERDRLTEERNDKLEAYDSCVIAKEHLIRAKETLSSRYIKPILDKFMYYHTMITGQNTREYMVDANIDVSVKEQGMNRSVLQLSKGLRDVVGLSLRMAFIDVMFPQEKPILILDDPFVNLDRANLEAAEKLMRIIAKDYQVIFFAAREETEQQIEI
ncbi:MAG: AAA family ATPase [Lachnospiraceae bacterium]|nr:AAA family ATPase [Lachnospiraceae bacterium]